MRASQYAQWWSFRIIPAAATFNDLSATAALTAVLLVTVPASAPAQTTDFGTTTKTVTLPKGSKVDPRYLLRRKKQPTDKTEPPKDEQTPAENIEQKAAQQLDARLLGAWTRVSSVSKTLTKAAVQSAAERCRRQLQLKPLQFETSAARTLPDIEALFGDIVYYRTEKGLQRLDINSGQIRLASDISARKLKNSQIVWTLTGQNMRLRLRFSKPLDNLPRARFMIEESSFYLRCPSNDDELFKDNG